MISILSMIIVFQSTLPTRGSDHSHAPLRSPSAIFQSTLPTRGSDASAHHGQKHDKSISIHAPHEGERPRPSLAPRPAPAISIHAPHEGERPAGTAGAADSRRNFNPRSPRGGATRLDIINELLAAIFQSTLPTRGSDRRYFFILNQLIRISIHAPHEGERLYSHFWANYTDYISIHAPHEGERRLRPSWPKAR